MRDSVNHEGFCTECGGDVFNVDHHPRCSQMQNLPGQPEGSLELSSRRALNQAKTLARAWVREANALGKSPATGHAFGKADGLLQAADDLKKAVDPVSKASTREWVES